MGAQDFNNDGYMDYLYTGTMNPNNVEITGEDTGGICGGDTDVRVKCPGPTLFLVKKWSNFILKSDLFIDNRVFTRAIIIRKKFSGRL